MRKFFFTFFIISATGFISSTCYAQPVVENDNSDDPYFFTPYTFELGASIGMMNCFTDLGGKKGGGKHSFTDLNLRNSKFAGSIYFSASYKYFISARFEGTFGRVKASDHILSNSSSPFRYQRNLSFRSTINEMTLMAEIHPFYFKPFPKGSKLPKYSPYLVGGIGYFSFNPKAKLGKTWTELKPLSTEGEGFEEYPDRKPYKLRQFNFPLGLGVKYKISSTVNTGVECLYRFLHTDYLDDVSTAYIDREVFAKHFSGSKLAEALELQDRKNEINPASSAFANEQRGNPNTNDSYFSINVRIGYVF